jgi:hypothetical protein
MVQASGLALQGFLKIPGMKKKRPILNLSAGLEFKTEANYRTTGTKTNKNEKKHPDRVCLFHLTPGSLQ